MATALAAPCEVVSGGEKLSLRRRYSSVRARRHRKAPRPQSHIAVEQLVLLVSGHRESR